MTPAERRERYASLAWLTDPDAWAPVDAALWHRCAGHMLPVERDRMNLEIRQYLRAHGAYSAPAPPVPANPPKVTLYGEPIEDLLSQFLGVPCSACEHAILAHRNLTGCQFQICDCQRTPWDFR